MWVPEATDHGADFGLRIDEKLVTRTNGSGDDLCNPFVEDHVRPIVGLLEKFSSCESTSGSSLVIARHDTLTMLKDPGLFNPHVNVMRPVMIVAKVRADVVKL